MDIVMVKIPGVLSLEALDRIEKRYEQKLKDAGCTEFVVVAISEGADISVLKV